MTNPIAFTTMDSPVGELLLVANGRALIGISFAQHRHALVREASWVRDDGSNGILADTRAQLEAYFAGDLTSFDLPLAPTGSPFEQRVWATLRTIPYGTTMSYGELARRIGKPKAARAVGSANGRNPISIVVPCHRVIGANGSLVGFGGGMERKQWLLVHEGAIPATLLPTVLR
jgi:methylated-DNA-[protein]-cysteine S-methyltransferase